MDGERRQLVELSRRGLLRAGLATAVASLATPHAARGAGIHGAAGWLFLSPGHGKILEAITARLIPGDAADPGAREAGVVRYIDRALASAYADQQPLYRRGLDATNQAARTRFGKDFLELRETKQDSLLREIEEGRAPGFSYPPPPEFFAVVLAHTIEGMFGDPAYGGNRDAAGWRLVGFPGARFSYALEEMNAAADLSAAPIVTLGDL